MKNLAIGYLVLAIGLVSCTTQTTHLPPLQSVIPNQPTNSPTLNPPTLTPTSFPPTLTPTLPPICQSPGTQDSMSDLSAEDVVSGMVERLNAGDVSRAMAYFEEDIHGYIIGFPPVVYEEYVRKDAICRTWDKYVNDNLEWEMNVITSTNTESGHPLQPIQRSGLIPIAK